MLRDSVRTIAAKLLILVIGIAASILIARKLGPAWRGALALIMLPQTIFLKAAPLGIDRGNIYFCAKEPERVRDIVRNSFWAGLIIGVAGFILFYIYTLTSAFESFSQGIISGFFIIIASTFPFLLISLYLDAVIYGRDMIGIRNLKEIGVNLLLLMSLIFGFFVMKKELLAAVGASWVVAIFGFIASLILIHKYISPVKLRGIDWSYLRRSFPFGLKNHISIAAIMLIFPVLTFIARSRLPQERIFERFEQIAFLAMAFAMFDRGMLMPRSIVFALVPKITGVDQDEALRWTLKASRYNILFTLIVFAILYFLIRDIAVLFYGKSFGPIAEPFKAMVPGAIFLSIGEVLAAGLFARGKVNAILAAGLLGFIVSTITGWYWLNGFSITGGALAATLGFFIYALVLFVAFIIEAPFSGKDMFILSQADMADIKGKLRRKAKS